MNSFEAEMPSQKTITCSSRLKGKGLHTGVEVAIELQPAPAGSGVVICDESPSRGGAPNVGCLFNSAREGEMEILSGDFHDGASPVNDGHNESGAK